MTSRSCWQRWTPGDSKLSGPKTVRRAITSWTVHEVFHALITELNVQRIDGMRLLSVAKQRNPEICAIMIASDADIELATEAMRQGAYDFQTKPLNLMKDEGRARSGSVAATPRPRGH